MTSEIDAKRQNIMERIEAARVRLLNEMSDDDREYAETMPAWSMEYSAYHATLVASGISNG